MPGTADKNAGVTLEIEPIYRREWGRAVASLVKITRDLQTAEDCVQDAFESAVSHWSRRGMPDNPGAWIRVAARRRFIDAARSSKTRREALARLAYLDTPDPSGEDGYPAAEPDVDDELALIFLCCHPAISATDQVMLTLRIVAGLRPAEIAEAFLAQHEAVRTRLLRAKRKIRGARIPIRMPPADQLETRFNQILATIYLIFNEGYLSSRGVSAGRPDLTAEAIRLAQHLVALAPTNGEVHGLLALLLLTEARVAARAPTPESLVPLDEQDRRLWDNKTIERGLQHLEKATRQSRLGRYGLQAAISAAHCTAPTADQTDWGSIVGFYDRLIEIEDSPVYRLNRCVAISFADSPLAALDELALLEGDGMLDGHYLLLATRGDLLRKIGRTSEALDAFEEASIKAENKAVKSFLHRRISELRLGTSDGCERVEN